MKTQRRPCSSSIPVAVSPIAAMLERFLLFLVLQYAVVSPRSVSSVFHVLLISRKRFVHAKCVSARRAPALYHYLPARTPRGCGWGPREGEPGQPRLNAQPRTNAPFIYDRHMSHACACTCTCPHVHMSTCPHVHMSTWTCTCPCNIHAHVT